MAEFRVRLNGQGSTEVVAYGVADAEHQIEKEFARCWPADAALDVVELARAEPGAARITEEFRAAYRIRAELRVSADSVEDARRAALRLAQQHLDGSRFRRVAWQEPIVHPGSDAD